MKLFWVLAILVVVGLGIDWVKDSMEAEKKRVAEKRKSESYVTGSIERGKALGAVTDINSYKNAFVRYQVERNKNPKDLKTLVAERFLPGGYDIDPFGQPYELAYEGREAVISSPGSDRVRGTPDDIVMRVPAQ